DVDDGQVGDRLQWAGNLRRVAVEAELAIVEVLGDLIRRRGRIRLAAIREVRVVVRELAVVERGRELYRVTAILGHLQPVVDGVRGARRNEPHVDRGTRRPRVPLVDGVSVGV